VLQTLINHRRSLLRAAVGGAVYLALAVGMERFLTPTPALWRPADGLHFAFVLLYGWTAAPVVAVAELLASAPGPLTALLGKAVLTALLHAGAARWVRPRLTRLNPAGPGVAGHFVAAVLLLALASGVLESGGAALLGISSLSGSLLSAPVLRAALRSAAGLAALTPVLLLLFWPRVHPWMRAVGPGTVLGYGLRGASLRRFGAQLALLASALALVAAWPVEGAARWLPAGPVVFWMAWRDGFNRAALGVALVMSGAGAMQGLGGIVSPAPFGSAYVALALSGWLVGLLASERQRSMRLMREAQDRAPRVETESDGKPKSDGEIESDGPSEQSEAASRNRSGMPEPTVTHAEPDTLEHWVQHLDATQDKLVQRTRELDASRRRLRAIQEQKDQLFANLSHEFRTPLTLILGPLDELRARLSDHLGDEGREQFDLIERNARRLLRLVRQILDLARLEGGDLTLDARPVDLADEVQRIARPFQPLAEQQRLTLTVETPPNGRLDDDARCHVDPEKLEHILGNLLSNAVKFTPKGGRITVRVRETTEAATIQVADTGVGIPPEQQERIFERFAQGNASATRAQEGSGIGLTLAHELAEAHGGILTVESTPDEGTTFSLCLPRGAAHLAPDQLADADDAPSLDEREPSEPPPPVRPSRQATPDDETNPSTTEKQKSSSDKPLVLAVDDNADVRRYVRSILEPSFAVRTASDGAEGQRAAAELLPDVVLTDVMMPEIDGIELTRRLKAAPATAAIPVVMLTARAEAQDEVRGLTGGADDYITKPFEPRILEMRVRGLLDLQRRLRRQMQRTEQHDDRNNDEAETDPPDGEGEGRTDDRSSFEEKARAAVREHLTDPSFDTEALAAELAMSRSTLYRRAGEHEAPAPAELIRTVRLERGAALLREGAGSVTEVAYAVGYERLARFSTQFKNHFGAAPSSYAKQQEAA
jgi:signal transduction histidine kinase/CheY-like chemotaxis protein